MNQKPCLITQCLPSCSSSQLFENFQNNKCESLPAGKTPFSASMSSVAATLDGATAVCVAAGTEILRDILAASGQFKSTFSDIPECSGIIQ